MKVHKPDNPLCPFVSTIGSATYNIARFISRILTLYAKKAPSYIFNTKELLEELQNIAIDPDKVLVSLDVKSLYTSVPTTKAEIR